ncbi:MAG: hypothetical protein IT350_05705 [Deltaproteobacteria bacterium]|nr:hypothetical protein [Deltaproteobacteria bacterium]
MSKTRAIWIAIAIIVVGAMCVTACFSRDGEPGPSGFERMTVSKSKSSYEEIAGIDIGYGADSVVFDDATDLLYASIFDPVGTVFVISLEDQSIAKTTAVSPGMHLETALAGDGRFLFVTNYDILSSPGDTVVRIDTHDGLSQRGMTVGSWPCGVRADAAGERVFVVTGCDNRAPTEDTGSGFAMIDAAAFNEANTSFFDVPETEFGELNVAAPDPVDRNVVYLLSDTNGESKNHLYSMSLENGEIGDSLSLECKTEESYPGRTFADIRVRENDIWFMQGRCRRLVGIDKESNSVLKTIELGCFSSGLAIRHDGIAAVSCIEDHEIRLIDLSNGKEIEAIQGVHTGAALSFDETGDYLFVADYYIGLVRIFRRQNQ